MIIFPPAPHDPRERDRVMMLGEWEVRLFGDRIYEYFRDRGLWHVQLWHPGRRISLLSPSRLTRGRWEAYPIFGWKQDAPSYAMLAEQIEHEHPVTTPTDAAVDGLERVLVRDLVEPDSRRVS